MKMLSIRASCFVLLSSFVLRHSQHKSFSTRVILNTIGWPGRSAQRKPRKLRDKSRRRTGTFAARSAPATQHANGRERPQGLIIDVQHSEIRTANRRGLSLLDQRTAT